MTRNRRTRVTAGHAMMVSLCAALLCAGCATGPSDRGALPADPGGGKGSVTNRPLHVTVELQDGSRLVGTPRAKALAVRTPLGKAQLPFSQLARLDYKVGREMALARMRNGDTLSCSPDFGTLRLTTVMGAVTILPGQIRSVSVSISGALPADLPDGVILYFACDDPSRAVDLSGRGHDGDLQGVTLAEDRFGRADGAYRVDGAQRISVPHQADLNLDLAASKTFSLWWKGDADIQHKILLAKFSRANEGRGFVVAILRNEGYYLSYQTHHMAQFGPGLTAGQWQHCAVVKDGSVWHVYQNGVEAAMHTSRGWPLLEDLTVLEPLEIGGTAKQIQDSFLGAIDDVCIFDRALSGDEVRSLYEQQRGDRP